MPNRNVNLAAEFRSSGKTQRAFCTERGISIDKLRYYLYKRPLRKVSSQQTMEKSSAVSGAPSFLSINREQVTSRISRSNCTIIVGSFSIAEISTLLSGAVRL